MRSDKLAQFFRKWEGGLSNDPNDSASKKPCPIIVNGKSGYHTNAGITYETWVGVFGENQNNRFIAMSDEDWNYIFKLKYWDRVQADRIKSDAIAATLVSWAWGSGANRAVRMMQDVVGAKVDGIIGSQTLSLINKSDESELFDKCIKKRKDFFEYISRKNPKNLKFLKGWLNRLKEFEQTFKP